MVIFSQIEQILNDTSEPLPGEEKLAALTAGERTHWASARRHFFNKGVNKISLDTIEKAAFVVALDDVPYEFDKVSQQFYASAEIMFYFFLRIFIIVCI